jgi:hypothetical protein
MENDEAEYCDWAEDKDFVAELNERVRRYEEGIDRGLYMGRTRNRH